MSKILRVGIIGCGNVALKFHLPSYQANPDRFEVVGLADPTPERLELGRSSAALATAQGHLDPQMLLARDDIDLVDICTPQHLSPRPDRGRSRSTQAHRVREAARRCPSGGG